ncbi:MULTISPECIES: Bor/Iss family lipoprotein [Enterobacter]|uniref:Bor/Iss family lipoprotein n=1 Tax=Enterobacter TaxID=547 RepID=UPI0038600B10
MYFYDSFGQSENIKAYSICPQGVGGIEYDKSLFDSFISVITLNILTPRRITFYCSG